MNCSYFIYYLNNVCITLNYRFSCMSLSIRILNWTWKWKGRWKIEREESRGRTRCYIPAEFIQSIDGGAKRKCIELRGAIYKDQGWCLAWRFHAKYSGASKEETECNLLWRSPNHQLDFPFFHARWCYIYSLIKWRKRQRNISEMTKLKKVWRWEVDLWRQYDLLMIRQWQPARPSSEAGQCMISTKSSSGTGWRLRSRRRR